MVGCSFKTERLGREWKCPIEAVSGEELCFWHKEEKGKKPTESQLKELTGFDILGVYLNEANLQKANLDWVNLEEADLWDANLQEANLRHANLQKATLDGANLENADLEMANLKKATLSEAHLVKAQLPIADLYDTLLYSADIREAELSSANLTKSKLSQSNLMEATLLATDLQEADLEDVNLRGASLYGARFDSKTVLNDSNFLGANLYKSYFDEVKSFRNAIVFSDSVEREINEVVGDALNSTLTRLFSNTYVLAFKEIKEKDEITSEIGGKGLIRYIKDCDCVIFFDTSKKCLIRNPENKKQNKDDFVKIEGLENLLFENGKIKPEYLYKGSRAMLYEASYEVYNNLYNFYIANGRLDKAAHVHYRRGEVHRKLKWEKGGLGNKFRSVFDYLVLKGLTGYGDRLGRPVWFSGFVIILFAALFKFFDGIVKNVNGITVKPDWIDYLYHSITTFTSLGYSNIQPNLASGHIPQLLVAVESGLGVTMIAIIIFVITYQVSR